LACRSPGLQVSSFFADFCAGCFDRTIRFLVWFCRPVDLSSAGSQSYRSRLKARKLAGHLWLYRSEIVVKGSHWGDLYLPYRTNRTASLSGFYTLLSHLIEAPSYFPAWAEVLNVWA
jgi:hypothetical protein